MTFVRRMLAVSLLSCVGSALLWSAAHTDGGGERKRRASGAPVVLIVIDTMRADHFGSYGHFRPTTPGLDALARRGVRYARAFSQAPWTTPSIGSLLTSQYPSTLGIKRAQSRLPESATLISEAFRARGYATAAVVSHSFCLPWARSWPVRRPLERSHWGARSSSAAWSPRPA
jgi:arylsulfatase A-like enzyme